MPTVIRTRIDPILLAIQARVMASAGLPAERVLVVDPDDLPYKPQADQLVCVWLTDGNVNLPILQGAGRVDARLTETVAVTLFTRFGVDETTSGLAWLTDANLGHALWRHKVLDALIDFWPVDGSNNALTCEPMVPVATVRPRRDPKEKNWGKSTVMFAVTYEAALTQTYQ